MIAFFSKYESCCGCYKDHMALHIAKKMSHSQVSILPLQSAVTKSIHQVNKNSKHVKYLNIFKVVKRKNLMAKYIFMHCVNSKVQTLSFVFSLSVNPSICYGCLDFKQTLQTIKQHRCSYISTGSFIHQFNYHSTLCSYLIHIFPNML